MTSMPTHALDGTEAGRLGDLVLDAWQRSPARNLDTASLATRTVLPGMVAAVDHAGHGITVNFVAPGRVVTGHCLVVNGRNCIAEERAGHA